MNGQVFPESKRKVGENAPPFHPWCRCTTAPYDEDLKGVGERWMRDPETGKGGYVPADMTYQEWKAKYVDKTGESGIINEEEYYAGFNSARKNKSKAFSSKRTEEVSQNYLNELPKLNKPESIEEAVAATNPKDYISNCQRCAPTLEMRMRGYNVTAAFSSENDVFGYDDFRKVFIGAEWKKCKTSNPKKEIIDFALNCPDGSRFEITARIADHNHVFSAIRSGEKCIFVDSMYGANDVEFYFDDFGIENVSFCRIDNLSLSDQIKLCLEW